MSDTRPTKQQAIEAARDAYEAAFDESKVVEAMEAARIAEAAADAAYDAYAAEMARIEQEYPDE